MQDILERWAPKSIAWEKDNVGLAVGSPRWAVRGILVALDVTEQTIAEAEKRRTNLLVSHHPLLFRPVRTIDPDTHTGRCIEALVRKKIALYSAHTNLDFTRGGTSFALASALGLQKVDFLMKSYRIQKKIATFVPSTHVDQVTKAMAAAGAGTIGNYELCSFQTEGTGTFQGNMASNPTTGKRGKLERVTEIRVEMVAPEWKLGSVISAMKEVHPYEEVAYDVFPTENISDEYGMGIVGEFERPVELKNLLALVKRSLGTRLLRFARGAKGRIKKVAACGGSGAELMGEAIRQGCDAFITADVKYHGFHDAHERITLIDAGHYETEFPVVSAVVRRLQEEFRRTGQRVPVYATRISTNPIIYT